MKSSARARGVAPKSNESTDALVAVWTCMYVLDASKSFESMKKNLKILIKNYVCSISSDGGNSSSSTQYDDEQLHASNALHEWNMHH